MARPREFDPDLILDRATELFWSKGYDGTSISDLEDHLGVGRQSLYGAFGDKHQLYVKAMERYGARQSGPRLALLRPGAGMAEIREYFSKTIAALTTEPRRSCLLVNAALESADDPAVAAKCNENQQSLTRAFRHALAGAMANGELPKGADVGAIALALVSQSYGLNVMARHGASAATLGKAVDAMLDALT